MTSAKPPVLANGTASDATIRTRTRTTLSQAAAVHTSGFPVPGSCPVRFGVRCSDSRSSEFLAAGSRASARIRQHGGVDPSGDHTGDLRLLAGIHVIGALDHRCAYAPRLARLPLDR